MGCEAILAAELRPRHGVTTRERLRRRGLTDRQIHGLTRNRRLRAVGRGVLVDTASRQTFEQRMAIACAMTRGVVMFPTAGTAWQFRGTPKDRRIHIAVDWSRRVAAPPGVVIHRTTSLPAEDVIVRSDGISITTPPRTAFDAAAVVDARALESMIEQGLDRRMFAVVTLARISARLFATARRGASTFRQVLASRPAWCKPVRSDLELELARAMEAAGFPRLVRGHPVKIGPGEIVHPDLGIPEDRFYVEVDHFTWHGGRRDSTYDRIRDMKLRLTGASVERVTDLAIETDLDNIVDHLFQLWQHRREGAGTRVTYPRLASLPTGR